MIIKRKLDDLKQTMTTRTAMLLLQYLDMVSILQRSINAERMATFIQYKTCRISQHLVIHSMQSMHTHTCKSCYVCQKLNQIRTGIHGKTPCGETQRQVLGRIVHRPNYRAIAYEKYKDTWRTDKRKGDD